MNCLHPWTFIDSIGKTVDILKGIKIASAAGDEQLFPAETPDLVTVNEEEIIESENPEFGPWIHLTFHPTFTSLLETFIGVQFADDRYCTSGLALKPGFSSDQDAQQEIANILGIRANDTIDQGKSFVFATYQKHVRNHKAKSVSFNQQYVDEFLAVDLNQADSVISLYSNYGTHYISEYGEGDFIYQVFVYDKAIFNEIQEFWPDEPAYHEGLGVVFFRPYTETLLVLPDGTKDGYSDYIGTIVAASGDEKFNEIRPLLFDDLYNFESLLMILTDSDLAEKTESMNEFIALQCVLKSVAKAIYSNEEEPGIIVLMENVLTGGIYQNHGAASCPGFPLVSEDLPMLFQQHFNPDLVSQTATSYTSIIQANFDIVDLKILNPAYVEVLFIFADVINLPENAVVSLPGTAEIYLLCREFISHSIGNSTPEIVVGGNPSLKIVASSFKGTMKVTFVSETTMHFTYINGSVLNTIEKDRVYTVAGGNHARFPLPSTVPQFYANLTSNTDFESTWLTTNFVSGLELLMMTVETVYSLKIGKSIQTAQESSLNWLIFTLTMARNQSRFQ